MSIPLWVLLAFAGWTLATLVATIGVYRWSRILTRRADIAEFRNDDMRGSDWYRRANRAHANCVENLPVYAAIVIVIEAVGVADPLLDTLALVIIAARVLQTLIHLSVPETNCTVTARFVFYTAQIASMIVMGVHVAINA